MSPREVERAITGPAERAGVRIDRGLVAEIVADVAEHPDALPLLRDIADALAVTGVVGDAVDHHGGGRCLRTEGFE